MFRSEFSCIFIALLSTLTMAQVTTSQYNNARTGAHLTETTLTPQNVNARQFGKLFSLPVDGDVYAQPLYLPGVEVPGKGVHNVIFIATEHDSVYAFDAEGNPSTPLWQATFINPSDGVTTVPEQDVRCPFIRTEVGITSTPVIDLKTGTIYVLARTKEHKGLQIMARAREHTVPHDEYVQKLHALAITTGAEKFGGPVVIRASVPGNGEGSSQGKITFNPLRDNPRAALLLANDKVYLTWASSCDRGPYHGWVMAYDAHSLAQTGVFAATPDASDGGIWLGDAGPAADAEGNVFVVTGNGKFDASTNGRDYGDSVLKMFHQGNNLTVRDYFTPFDQEDLNDTDKDLGSGGPVLLPEQPGAHPHELVVAGKGGTLYGIDRDHMGKFHARNDSHAVQSMHVAPGETFGAAAYWNQHVYYSFSDDYLRDYAVDRGSLTLKKMAKAPRIGEPGATPTVSANGAKNGIVWVLASGSRGSNQPALLIAYDAADITSPIYDSRQNAASDQAGKALRFNIPTVMNGRVYVGAKGEVDVYGLLPAVKH